MRTLISNPTIVTDGEQFRGSIVINNDKIVEILRGEELPRAECDCVIEATGLYLIPGVIDDHEHFREPGLTHKANISSESRAAAAGGVTSYMEMPNTVPQTTTIKALKEKYAIAAKESLVNYSFYYGATNENVESFDALNRNKVCGIKLFMGSSTGNMLVDKLEKLEKIFAKATEIGMPIAVHCEESSIISENTKRIKETHGEDAGVEFHPIIRSREACYNSTKSAIELAKKHNSRLHIMHISTEEELGLLTSEKIEDKNITAEATPSHLTFCDSDYSTLGTRIKCNPAIKTANDRSALRNAINENRIDIIGTDHAPHLLGDKEGGALKAASGMPSIQFSLQSMLQLVNEGVFSIETLVEKMCHAPAKLFGVHKRGYIRKGYCADFVLIDPNRPQTVKSEDIISICGWSPFEGRTFDWSIRQTWINGQRIYNDGKIDDSIRGKALRFER